MPPILAVDGPAGPAAVTLFPSPNDGDFSVLAPGIKGRVRVLDVRGREVMAPVRLGGGSLALRIDVGAGLYLVRIDEDNGGTRTLRMAVR